MYILKLIKNKEKLVYLLCHFAAVTLNHLEKHMYNPNNENCNPLPIDFILWCAECCRLRNPYRTKINNNNNNKSPD